MCSEMKVRILRLQLNFKSQISNLKSTAMPDTTTKPMLAPKPTRIRNRLETHAAAIEVCKRLADMQLALSSLPSLDRFVQIRLDAQRVVEMDKYDRMQDRLANQTERENAEQAEIMSEIERM